MYLVVRRCSARSRHDERWAEWWRDPFRKALSQIGHAAPMTRADSGVPIAAAADAAVRDGGLTEVAAGSETVLVVSPPDTGS